MNGIEEVGDVLTAGLIARAVEPADGGAEAGKSAMHERAAHSDICLNCGTALAGGYCHACGQAAQVHRTLTAFWHDLLHGVLHFEGKIWHTLPMLAWRPGDLTRRYVAGERARFVSPLALFLFCVFLTFAVFGWTGGPFGTIDDSVKVDQEMSIAQGIDRADRKVAAIEKHRVETIASGRSAASIDAELKNARDEASMLRLIKERGVTEATLMRASDDLPSSLSWVNAAYKKAKSNPSLLLYKLQNNAYKYSWALIPISVPFMWLLFPFSRRFRLYDHAVFVTYSLCFVTLLLVVLSFLKVAGAHGVTALGLLLVIPPLHMYRQLRGAYGLRWWSALLRTLVLLLFSTIAAALFSMSLLALGVLG